MTERTTGVERALRLLRNGWRRTSRATRWTLRLAFLVARAAVVVLFTILLVRAFDARRMPELALWHTEELDAEFERNDYTPQYTLRDYLAREDALFAELDEQVLDQVDSEEALRFSRYAPEGHANPKRFERDWNRTFELEPDEVRGGALLLHGLTDSPYSLRRVGEILHAEGYYVLGLRLPGHGTIPNALNGVGWRDWIAAAKVGARHVHATVAGKGPLIVVGYSNGGAVGLEYSILATADGELPLPDRIVLFSPAIGITRLAMFARWAKVFAVVPYFEKAKWSSIAPEYDPFKYASATLNGGDQTFRLTRRLQRDLGRLPTRDGTAGLPPILTFQSVVDSTVITRAVIERLYARLESPESELVLFDINRAEPLSYFVAGDPRAVLAPLETGGTRAYRYTLITNIDASTDYVVEQSRPAGGNAVVTVTDVALAWPDGVYSLSHVAVPFPPDDMVYGTPADQDPDRYNLELGAIELRGERHVLRVSANDYMRLRYNPFFPYVERRLRELAHEARRAFH